MFRVCCIVACCHPHSMTQTDKEATTRNLLGAGKVLVTQSCLCNSWTIVWPSRLLSPWNFPGKNTGVGSHPLLQGIFPTQGSNLGLLHYRQTLYHLSHLGSPSSEQMGELWQVSHQQLNGWFRVLLANTWFHWPTLVHWPHYHERTQNFSSYEPMVEENYTVVKQCHGPLY